MASCGSSSSNKRFCEVNKDVDPKKFRYAKGTLYQTDYSKKLFKDYITMKEYLLDCNSPEFKATLDSSIHDFLLAVRKEDGEQYSIAGFNGLFFGLARSIMEDFSIDLIKDPAFIKTTNAKKAVKAILKKCGKGHVSHTQIISDNDLEKLATFNTTTPLNIQLKTWFLLHFHLALRGNENCHDMTKEDILFGSEDGVKYVELRDMLTKNHRGNTTDKSNEAKMFSTSDKNCPVLLVEKYLSKLNPDNNFIWQRPKKKFCESSPIWFDNAKIGANTMSTFMKTLSSLAKLSKVYTNHCPRATCITILGKTYQDTDVASHSGHQSLTALKIYKKTSESTKKNMSHTLTSILSTTHPGLNESESSSSNVPPVQLQQMTSSHHANSNHLNCCLSFGAQDSSSDRLEVNRFADNVEETLQASHLAELDLEFDKYMAAFEPTAVPISSDHVSEKSEEKVTYPQAPPGFNNCKCIFSNCTFTFR